MSCIDRTRTILIFRLALAVALSATVISLTSCKKPETAKTIVQQTFGSPDAAGAAFLDAAKTGDENALVAIFGPDAKNVLFSGDAVKDKNALQDFVAAYNQMHRWREVKAGGEVLMIGADNYAFPIPLGKNPSGQWYFDTAAGKDEILARRIGKDELTAIAACSAIADAERKYFSQSHDGEGKQYTQKFISDEGKQDGLYWTAAEGQAASPFADVRDFAKAAGYTNAGDKPQPFNGYYFRILSKQGDQAKGGARNYIVAGKMTGGFAVIAYPAQYRDSGIMTFLVGPDGVVLQKDLGENTLTTAQTMDDYNPGEGWRPAL